MAAAEICSIFVGNLSWGTTNEDLKTFASQAAGEITEAKVQTHLDTGRSKGWGLVTFTSAADAKAAVDTLTGKDLDGRTIFVRLDRSKLDEEEAGLKSIFVGNLPWSATSAQLEDIFSEYSPADVHVKTNMAGRSRGFAILKFGSEDDAARVISAMNGYELEGRQLQVREDRPAPPVKPGGRAPRGTPAAGRNNRRNTKREGDGAPREPAPDSNTLFVGNLAWSTTSEDLSAAFSDYGTVESAEVQQSPSGRSKGWALVTMSSIEEAKAAAEAMAGSELGDPPRRISVRMDRKKE